MGKIDSDDFSPENQVTATLGHGKIISKSPAMQGVLDLAIAAARSSYISVLLRGESGTGKGLLAREIHAASRRSRGPFIGVNCGAPNRNMIEDELFGHEKGAFTGAVVAKPGIFERASGGTIFLDEVAELPVDLQVKLFGVLDTRSVTRLGGSREIPIDVQVISATNQDLELAIRQSRFRPELYHRINTLPIAIPPLRERTEDILPLARHFLARFGKDKIPAINRIAPEVESIFQSYYWSGNVRELENVIERMVAISNSDELTVQYLPDNLVQYVPAQAQKPPFTFRPARISLTEHDVQHILGELRQHRGIKSRAARELGLTRGQLDYRLKLIEQMHRK